MRLGLDWRLQKGCQGLKPQRQHKAHPVARDARVAQRKLDERAARRAQRRHVDDGDADAERPRVERLWAEPDAARRRRERRRQQLAQRHAAHEEHVGVGEQRVRVLVEPRDQRDVEPLPRRHDSAVVAGKDGVRRARAQRREQRRAPLGVVGVHRDAMATQPFCNRRALGVAGKEAVRRDAAGGAGGAHGGAQQGLVPWAPVVEREDPGNGVERQQRRERRRAGVVVPRPAAGRAALDGAQRGERRDAVAEGARRAQADLVLDGGARLGRQAAGVVCVGGGGVGGFASRRAVRVVWR